MKTNRTIDVAKIYRIEEISEFGVTIKTTGPIAIDECVVFHGEFFGDKSMGEVVARCYAITPGSVAGENFAAFVFVGVDPGTFQNIRKWLRQEYARNKQKS